MSELSNVPNNNPGSKGLPNAGMAVLFFDVWITFFNNVAYVEFTPEMAEQALALPGRNRRLNPHTVRKYRTDILSGDFCLQEAMIVFAKSEDSLIASLINGQHRLQALLQAAKTNPEVTLRAVVRIGADQKEIINMDQGDTRTITQTLGLEYKNANALASTVRFLYFLEKGMTRTGTDGLFSHKLSRALIGKIILQHPDLPKIIDKVFKVSNKKATKNREQPIPASMFAATYYLYGYILGYRFEMHDFFEIMCGRKIHHPVGTKIRNFGLYNPPKTNKDRVATLCRLVAAVEAYIYNKSFSVKGKPPRIEIAALRRRKFLLTPFFDEPDEAA